MTGRLQGKVFIITGANRGIGKAIAGEFLRAGALVVISGRDLTRLESARLEFENMGYAPISIAADLCDPEDCKKLIRSTVDHFGMIHGLVNNAGLPARGRIENIDSALFAKIVEGNLNTAVNCTRAALPELIKSKGSVIFLSSVAAIQGFPNAAAYSTAKIGLERFAEALRIEMHHQRVHVGILRPGLVNPPADKRVLTGDGSFKPVSHRGHQSQKSVAKAVLRMVLKRRNRITMTPAGRFLSAMKWLAPGLVRFILIRTQFSSRYETTEDQ